MVKDRRRSPRMRIEPIRARVVGVQTEVAIDEVGFGGFRIKSSVAFEQDAEYEFLVLPLAGSKVRRVDGKAIHCRVISTDPVVFETGFAFSKDSRSATGIEALIGRVSSSQESSRHQPIRVRVVPGTRR